MTMNRKSVGNLLNKEMEMMEDGWDIVGRRDYDEELSHYTQLERRAKKIHSPPIKMRWICGEINTKKMCSLMVRGD